jgi:hypothetical protein
MQRNKRYSSDAVEAFLCSTQSNLFGNKEVAANVRHVPAASLSRNW